MLLEQISSSQCTGIWCSVDLVLEARSAAGGAGIWHIKEGENPAGGCSINTIAVLHVDSFAP